MTLQEILNTLPVTISSKFVPARKAVKNRLNWQVTVRNTETGKSCTLRYRTLTSMLPGWSPTKRGRQYAVEIEQATQTGIFQTQQAAPPTLEAVVKFHMPVLEASIMDYDTWVLSAPLPPNPWPLETYQALRKTELPNVLGIDMVDLIIGEWGPSNV